MGRINDVLIVANRNLVPIDFIVLDIDCNLSCPIILGRPFVRTIGAIIDMKEGNIRFQFPLKKGMEHFPRKILKLPYESIMRATYESSAQDGTTQIYLRFYAQLGALNNSACWEAPQFYFYSFLFFSCLVINNLSSLCFGCVFCV